MARRFSAFGEIESFDGTSENQVERDFRQFSYLGEIGPVVGETAPSPEGESEWQSLAMIAKGLHPSFRSGTVPLGAPNTAAPTLNDNQKKFLGGLPSGQWANTAEGYRRARALFGWSGLYADAMAGKQPAVALYALRQRLTGAVNDLTGLLQAGVTAPEQLFQIAAMIDAKMKGVVVPPLVAPVVVRDRSVNAPSVGTAPKPAIQIVVGRGPGDGINFNVLAWRTLMIDAVTSQRSQMGPWQKGTGELIHRTNDPQVMVNDLADAQSELSNPFWDGAALTAVLQSPGSGSTIPALASAVKGMWAGTVPEGPRPTTLPSADPSSAFANATGPAPSTQIGLPPPGSTSLPTRSGPSGDFATDSLRDTPVATESNTGTAPRAKTLGLVELALGAAAVWWLSKKGRRYS